MRCDCEGCDSDPSRSSRSCAVQDSGYDRSVRLLVADDHPETRRLVARNLALAGHGVKAVGTCAEAAASLGDEEFDAAILDVMMPDGSGIDLCKRLRAGRVATPILLLTARGDVRS